jgi:hypothetical protein
MGLLVHVTVRFHPRVFLDDLIASPGIEYTIQHFL